MSKMLLQITSICHSCQFSIVNELIVKRSTAIELLVEQLPKARQGGLVMTSGLAVIIKLYWPGID